MNIIKIPFSKIPEHIKAIVPTEGAVSKEITAGRYFYTHWGGNLLNNAFDGNMPPIEAVRCWVRWMNEWVNKVDGKTYHSEAMPKQGETDEVRQYEFETQPLAAECVPLEQGGDWAILFRTYLRSMARGITFEAALQQYEKENVDILRNFMRMECKNFRARVLSHRWPSLEREIDELLTSNFGEEKEAKKQRKVAADEPK